MTFVGPWKIGVTLSLWVVVLSVARQIITASVGGHSCHLKEEIKIFFFHEKLTQNYAKSARSESSYLIFMQH